MDHQPDVQMVGGSIDANGDLRAYLLTVRRKSRAKTITVRLYSSKDAKPVKLRVEWPGWAVGSRRGVHLEKR